MSGGSPVDLNQILANMQADVMLGKNVEVHYVELLQLIEHCNQKADEAQRTGNTIDHISFARVGYELYRLKDAYIVALANKS